MWNGVPEKERTSVGSLLEMNAICSGRSDAFALTTTFPAGR